MKAHQLATLVLRLLGIYCLIQAIPEFNFFINTIPFVRGTPVGDRDTTSSNITLIVVLALPSFLQLFAGILLLLRSATWGERLLANENRQESVMAISFQQGQLLAFAVAGLLIFANALPSLFTGIFNLATWLEAHVNHSEFQSKIATTRSILTAFGALARALLGLGLFFGAQGFANFWHSMRNFGTPKPPVN